MMYPGQYIVCYYTIEAQPYWVGPYNSLIDAKTTLKQMLSRGLEAYIAVCKEIT